MPREDEAYRDNLVELSKVFGEKRLLSRKDVAKFCKCDPRTATDRFDIPKGGIMMATLARRMCH